MDEVGVLPCGNHTHFFWHQSLLDPQRSPWLPQVFPCICSWKACWRGSCEARVSNFISTADTCAPDLHPAQSNCATACSNYDNHSSKAVGASVLSPANPANCLDEDRSCVTWEGQGESLTNPAFMLKACRQACGACQPAMPVNHQARNSYFSLASPYPILSQFVL